MGARAIRNLVIVLGILIVVAFAAVIWGIFNAGRDDGNAGIAPALQDLALGLPSVCAIEEARLQGARMTVRTGPAGEGACQRVFVIDLASGRVVATVRP